MVRETQVVIGAEVRDGLASDLRVESTALELAKVRIGLPVAILAHARQDAAGLLVDPAAAAWRGAQSNRVRHGEGSPSLAGSLLFYREAALMTSADAFP